MTEKSHCMYMLDRLGLIDCSHPFLLGLDPHECYYFIIIQLYYKYDVIFFFFYISYSSYNKCKFIHILFLS